MTKDQALQYVHAYGSKGKLNEDEAFMYTESLRFLIEETEETRWMVELGGYYYELRDFDLALKYYEMADRFGDRWAPEGLGYAKSRCKRAIFSSKLFTFIVFRYTAFETRF